MWDLVQPETSQPALTFSYCCPMSVSVPARRLLFAVPRRMVGPRYPVAVIWPSRGPLPLQGLHVSTDRARPDRPPGRHGRGSTSCARPTEAPRAAGLPRRLGALAVLPA